MSTYIKNVVIIGGGGNVGSHILNSLLSTGKFTITAVTREDSQSTFPTSDSITIKKGSYDDSKFLSSVFEHQDALILALHPMALMKSQTGIIEAAASAGVKWILPTEYGTDTSNEVITNAVMVNSMKVPSWRLLEKLSHAHGVKWIGVITGLWFEKCLTEGFFLIDTKARTAKLLDGGKGRFNTTLKSTVGLAISNLLTLPETADSGPSLADFKNGFCYLSSFLTSQKEVLESVQRVTGTREDEWKVEMVNGTEWIKEGEEKLKKFDMSGMVNILGGMVLTGAEGVDYESVKGTSNEVLGLPKEDMDTVVKNILERSEST